MQFQAPVPVQPNLNHNAPTATRELSVVDADKPTCKFVRVPGKGARVYPKGCRVRYELETVDGRDVVRKYKRGTGSMKPYKRTLNIPNRELVLNVRFGTKKKQTVRKSFPFVYDTGATETTGPLKTFREAGIFDEESTTLDIAKLTEKAETMGFKFLYESEVTYADDSRAKTIVYEGPLYLPVSGDEVMTIFSIVESDSASHLLGISTINKLKRLKVKFRHMENTQDYADEDPAQLVEDDYYYGVFGSDDSDDDENE